MGSAVQHPVSRSGKQAKGLEIGRGCAACRLRCSQYRWLVDVKLCEDVWSTVCTSSGARRQETEDSDKRIWFSVASEHHAVCTPTPESALWHRAALREASCACAICPWTSK